MGNEKVAGRCASDALSSINDGWEIGHQALKGLI
jgi:hypothetical protein